MSLVLSSPFWSVNQTSFWTGLFGYFESGGGGGGDDRSNLPKTLSTLLSPLVSSESYYNFSSFFSSSSFSSSLNRWLIDLVGSLSLSLLKPMTSEFGKRMCRSSVVSQLLCEVLSLSLSLSLFPLFIIDIELENYLPFFPFPFLFLSPFATAAGRQALNKFSRKIRVKAKCLCSSSSSNHLLAWLTF